MGRFWKFKTLPLPTMISSSSPKSPPPPPPNSNPHLQTTPLILEFVLRQPSIPDSLANAILLALPLPLPLSRSLNKTILLRRLASDLRLPSLSDRTLATLELIHDLDRRAASLPPSGPMRLAYLAVAVQCAAKALRDPEGDFGDAVERVWRRRVTDLENSEAAGLLPAGVREWRKVMEEALVRDEAREVLRERDTLKEAVEAVGAYLKHEFDAMGPPLLELLAEAVPAITTGLTKERGGIADGGTGFMGLDRAIPVQSPRIANSEIAMGLREHQAGPAGGTGFVGLNREMRVQSPRIAMGSREQRVGPADGTGSMGLDREMGFQLPRVLDNHKGCATANGHEASGQDGCSRSKFDRLSTSVVSKVSEALRTSCADLLMAVEDPLPGAVNTASMVLASRLGEATNIEKPQENHNQVDGHDLVDEVTNVEEPQKNHNKAERNEPVPAVEMGAEVTCPEGPSRGTPHTKESVAVQLSRHADPNSPDPKEVKGNQDRMAANAPDVGEDADATHKEDTSTSTERNKYRLVPRPSLMERNPTAHTFEWDDSIDSLSESSPSQSKRRRLPSPRRMDVSPLMFPENKILCRQRRRKKWSVVEEDTLREAVKKYGQGNWKFILSSNNEIFEGRTQVDLKDKWRNMTRH